MRKTKQYASLHDVIWDQGSCLDDVMNTLRRNPKCINETDRKMRGYRKPDLYGHVWEQSRRRRRRFPRNCLPLSASLERGRYDIAFFLLMDYPQAAESTDDNGRLPLHFLFYDLKRHPPRGLVSGLISAFPKGLHTADKDGEIPFRRALLPWAMEMIKLNRKKTLETLNIMFDMYPKKATNISLVPFIRDALTSAVRAGEIDMVKLITTRYTGHPKLPFCIQSDHMCWAARYGCLTIFETLVAGPGGHEALTSWAYFMDEEQLPIHAVTNVNRFDSNENLNENYSEIARLIIQIAPETIMAKKRNGKLPIHEIISAFDNYDVRFEIIKLLVDNGPSDMLKSPTDDHYRKLPIHLAMDRNEDTDTIEFLASKAPDTVLVAYDDNLFSDRGLAIYVTRNLKTFCILSEICPASLAVSRSDGGLPIHVLLENGVFQSLKFDDNLKRKCFQLLLVHSPLDKMRTGGKISSDGSSVLHLALSKKNLSLELLAELLQTLQEQNLLEILLQQHNRYGATPLHVEIEYERTKKLIEMCSNDSLQKVLQMKDTTSPFAGNTPLQAVLNRIDLLKAERTRLEEDFEEDQYDENGFFWESSDNVTNAKYEKELNDSLALIELLVQSCPQSLLIRNNQQGLLPVQIAAKNELPHRIVHYLVVSTPVFDIDTLTVACNIEKRNCSSLYEYLRGFPEIMSAL